MNTVDLVKQTKEANDEDTFDLDGETITKSVVGAVQFAVFKGLAARIATVEKLAAEDREARLEGEYLAQAHDEMGHLPGDMAMKARVLRAIDEGIEDDD